MIVRDAQAVWHKNLKQGNGTIRFSDFEKPYSFASRFEPGGGTKLTNPEELIAAAHSGCFSMALANTLSQAGHEPASVRTTAKVHLDQGAITKIVLHTEAEIPGLDDESEFKKHAETAKKNCPLPLIRFSPSAPQPKPSPRLLLRQWSMMASWNGTNPFARICQSSSSRTILHRRA